MKKKFKIHTLECKTNQYESQGYTKQLTLLGYEEVGDLADALIGNIVK